MNSKKVKKPGIKNDHHTHPSSNIQSIARFSANPD
jgi:hypothetical protein